LPDIGWGGGKVTLHDPRDYPITIQLSDERRTIPPYSFIMPGFIVGANMAFRRSVLEQIGGLDPNFGPGNRYVCDDPDVQARASFAGWSGVYDPALRVAHHHGRDAAAAQQLDRIYRRSMGAYYAKFVLRSDTRLTFAKALYWHYRTKTLLDSLQEAQGAIGYVIGKARKSSSGARRPTNPSQ
jgi:GT2 family glycosyltransferase